MALVLAGRVGGGLEIGYGHVIDLRHRSRLQPNEREHQRARRI
jgi:hypothetical protein